METITEVVIVSTTNTIKNITNHQLLTNKTSTFNGFYCVLGHIPLRFNGFNKPPIQDNNLPTGAITVSIKTNIIPITPIILF